MDNSAHFWNYNASLSPGHRWQENPYFLWLDEQRRQRSRQMAKEKRRRLARRELQQSILRLLIDADGKAVHINDIAEHIGRSRQSTVRFLSTHADDLWINANGVGTWWLTSLRFLPDRLFY